MKEGLDEVEVVVDASNSQKQAQEVLVEGTAGRRGRALREGGLCEPEAAATGTRTFEDWLRGG